MNINEKTLNANTNREFDILFAIMAVQEVVFFAPIAKRLEEAEGLKVVFLTFHEAGDDILEREGIPYFSLHKMKRLMNQKTFHPMQIKDIEDILNIQAKKLMVHEMLTANRQDEIFLHNKVIQYYSIIDKIFKENSISCVVQELGGFVAPQLLYYLSRYHNVNHIFVEPAMFPKRVVFTLNRLFADIDGYADSVLDDGLNRDVEALVKRYMDNKIVVIPKKDRHFFQDMTLKRIFSLDNFQRLTRKLYHKYIIGREEEYNAISWYIVYHFMKLFRRKILKRYYSDSVAGEKYIYFPFHVPLDVQLTVRCPEFLNQEALVEQIAASIPDSYMLYIKEHPAAIGGHSLDEVKRLTALKNVRLLHPRNNSYDIIKNASCVITINSKVGFEAIMQGKPVVVLGKTFYRGKGVTVDVDNISGVADALTHAIRASVNKDKREGFLSKAFEWSYPGELYENSAGNVENFYQSLKSFLTVSGTLRDNGRIAKEVVQ